MSVMVLKNEKQHLNNNKINAKCSRRIHYPEISLSSAYCERRVMYILASSTTLAQTNQYIRMDNRYGYNCLLFVFPLDHIVEIFQQFVSWWFCKNGSPNPIFIK